LTYTEERKETPAWQRGVHSRQGERADLRSFLFLSARERYVDLKTVANMSTIKFLKLVLFVWPLLLRNSQKQQQASGAEENDGEFCGVNAVESSEVKADSASNNETPPASPTALEDFDENCHGWADRGECEINPDYMLNFCNKSCESFLDIALDHQTQNDEEDEEETP